MEALKKNFILSNKQQKGNAMALLTLEKLNNGTYGTLKVFSLQCTQPVLCISSNGKEILNQPITLQNNICKIKLESKLNLNSTFACVLCESKDAKIVPLVWDSENGNAYKSMVVQNMQQQTPAPTPPPDNAKNLDELFDIQSPEEIEEIINQSLPPEQPILFKQETDKIKNDLKEGQIFFDLVSKQLEDIFSKYPPQSELEKLIPSSKWVQVNFNDTTQQDYVLGLIYEDINLKYICYGIPGTLNQNPPPDLDEYSQWLPLDVNNPNGQGYWVIYQDALSGDNIKIEYI